MGSVGDKDMCWICLEEDTDDGDSTLYSPCKCPRKVHPQCLARWQLQQAGRHEEKFCRFCNTTLTDWKQNLTPEELKPEVSKVQPIMVVYFEGQIHRIPVKQGEDGLTEFTTKIRELFRLPEDVDISLTFGCKEPMSGQHLKLEGMGAFDAAVHCASVAAAERQHKVKKSLSTGNLNSNGAVTGSPAIGRSPSSHNLTTPSSGAAGAGSTPLASGPSAAAESDRRRRFQAGGHRQHANTFHVRNGSSGQQRPTSASTTTLPPLPGGASPAAAAGGGQQQPADTFRNILSMVSGGGAGGGGAAAYAAQRGGSATSQTPPDLEGPEQSSRSMSALPSAGLRERLKSGRYSSRNITQLTDVPEMDETVAVGSLSGKFKLTLKAFSRKVARSLSFTNKGSSNPDAGSSRPNGVASRAPSVTAGPGMPPLPPRAPAGSAGSFTIPTGAAGVPPAGAGNAGASAGMGPLTAGAASLRPPLPVPAASGPLWP